MAKKAHILNAACSLIENHLPKFAPVLRVAQPIQFPDFGVAGLPKNIGDYRGFLGERFALTSPVVAIFSPGEMTVIADRCTDSCGSEESRCFFLFQWANHEMYPPEALKFVWGQIQRTELGPADFDDGAIMRCSSNISLSHFGVFHGARVLVEPKTPPHPHLTDRLVLGAVMRSLVNAMRLIAYIQAYQKFLASSMPPGAYRPSEGKKIPRIPNRPVFQVRDSSPS